MHSSVIFWMAGRRPSTRRKVNGLDSIRRNRVCSSASEVNTERGRLSTVESMCSFQCGKPSMRSSTLIRESEKSARASSWPVISHGVLPFQIFTRNRPLGLPSMGGGGANGQRASRSIGYSGMSTSVSVSDMSVPRVSLGCRWPGLGRPPRRGGRCRSGPGRVRVRAGRRHRRRRAGRTRRWR